MRRTLFVLVLGVAVSAFAQANGKLQMHFIDVGQGMGTLVVSPNGETVLFDDGNVKDCDKPVSYLQQLGVTKIDYHVTSHYHSDHIGCAPVVFHDFPLQKDAFDRGSSYNSSVYTKYKDTVGTHRKTATAGQHVTLDVASAHPVTITFVALNGNGVSTTNENDLSLVSLVAFDDFRAELGGDLSGQQSGDYADIETSVAPLIGQVDVYEVHHHGSRYSSNTAWLGTIKPRIGIVSSGDGNDYHHPTAECLTRLHDAGIHTYWTETGNGVPPDPDYDIVGGNIIVEISPGAHEYTVTPSRQGLVSVTYPTWRNAAPTPAPPASADAVTYAWSTKSTVYHVSTCKYVQNISAANLQQGATPPPGKTLHQGCPK